MDTRLSDIVKKFEADIHEKLLTEQQELDSKEQELKANQFSYFLQIFHQYGQIHEYYCPWRRVKGIHVGRPEQPYWNFHRVI